MLKRKTILVAPLHWGLGHATRCIPIIEALLTYDFNVLIGSDGAALALLRKEFPALESIELPAYDITYPEKGNWFAMKLLTQFPHIKKVIGSEENLVAKLVAQGRIDGIISDNRLGVYHMKVPSVYITHQLQVLSGKTTRISTSLHQRIIKKFDACWVPDAAGSINLSGKLGHPKLLSFEVHYLGPLSRFTSERKSASLEKKYDVLILLSGPEPQRGMLEKQMMETFKDDDRDILLVRGVVENQQNYEVINGIICVNYLQSTALKEAILTSDLVVSRSGYTSIMDLASLNKAAFFIPTPGQYEQKYLAKRLKDLGMVASCKQGNFRKEKLRKVPMYAGLPKFEMKPDYKNLFSLFHGERKL